MKLGDLKLLCSHAYVNGQWVLADDGARFTVRNPANGKTITEVSSLGPAQTAQAIAAAHAALPAWRDKTAKERSTVLRQWFDLIMANQEDLARLLSWEQGKPLAESRGEIAYGASFIEWFAEEVKRIYGDVIPHDKQGRRLLVIKQAIGVVAAITPWNFPNAMITRKVGPALAAGCTVVLKPASLSALALAELGEREGIPAGVFNVVTGTRSREIGAELTGNKMVQKLTFTGSTAIGKLLMEQCAETIKKVSLELGGNAPFIVFEDADLDSAVEGAMGSKFRNGGQTCVCTNRLLVQNSVYDEFVKRLSVTEFGLAAYVYTRVLSRAWRVSEALECGMVGVNEGLISTEVAPFGGIKQSGWGREGSRYGIDDYIEQKYICMGIG